MRYFILGFLANSWMSLSGGTANAQVILAGYAESSIRRYAENGSGFSFLVPPGGASGVVGPSGVAFGPDGMLYVSNQTSVFAPGAPDSIVKVNPSTGAVSTFIDLPTGYVPAGIAFGTDGSLYVSHNRGQSSAANSGSVDRFNGTTGALISTPVMNLTQPTGLLFDNSGNLYVSNFGAGNIVKFNGTTQSTLVAPGSGGLASPAGMRIGSDNRLYVVDLLLGAVRRYDPNTGAFVSDFISAGGQLTNQFPSDLLFDRSGHVLVANLGSDFSTPTGSIKEFDALTGAYITDFATGIVGASQLALAPVPEPTTFLLCGFAAIGVIMTYHRRRHVASEIANRLAASPGGNAAPNL